MERQSNLQSFLDSTTPLLQTRSLSKSCFQELNSFWHPAVGREIVNYFNLSDLWECYEEWSAYGVGVPFRLSNDDEVIQYYAPSLSAIQIYTSKGHPASRNGTEDSESESWSDDSESEKLSRSWDDVSEDSGFDNETSCLAKECFGDLYLQFFEGCSPYGRMPLADKVYELALSYPGLTSFKSVEVSPASWMSVAWYPIYHIPNRRNVKELTTCFLTYHTISSSLLDHVPEGVQNDVCCAVAGSNKSKELRKCISLAPFGLATYKMQRELWINPEAGDQEKVVSLLSAADSWLKELKIQHHDFNFFSTHSP